MAANLRVGSAVGTQFLVGTDPMSVTGPSGAASGDLVVVCIESTSGITVATPPTGFVADTTAVEGTTDGRGRNFLGPFDSVGAGPYSFDIDSARPGVAIAAAVQGADLSTSLDVASTTLSETASTTTWAGPSQTPTRNGVCFLCFAGLSPNQATFSGWATTAPAGAAEALESGWTDHSIMLAYLDQATAAAASLSGTWPISEPKWAIQMAIRPASALAIPPSRRRRIGALLQL